VSAITLYTRSAVTFPVSEPSAGINFCCSVNNRRPPDQQLSRKKYKKYTNLIITMTKTTRLSVTVTVMVSVTVGVVEVGVVDTRYGVSQPGSDAER